jgi:galactose mutarotase-like enzyme
MDHFIDSNSQRLSISDQGGLVLSWQVLNPNTLAFEHILYQGSSLKRTGIPILFPFANPLENNIFDISGLTIGQHGFARHSQWSSSQVKSNQITLILDHTHITPEMRLAYPFEFELSLSVYLQGENQFIYNLITTNTGNKPLPIAPGIHPYFPVSHVQKKSVIIPEIPSFDAQSFDWENPRDGTFYDFEGLAKIQFPDKTITLDTRQSEIDYQHLVVWSQYPEQPDSDFICFEPFSRDTNAINTDPILVAPGKSLESKIIFEVNF